MALTYLLMALLFGLGALANTEQVRFRVANEEVNPALADFPSKTLSLTHNTLTDQIAPATFSEKITHWFKVDVDDGDPTQMYEVRVCWPASHPAVFELEYTQGHVGLTYSSDYYSHDPALMQRPMAVPYQVILNKVVLDALPSDILSVIGVIIAAVAGAYALRNKFF